MVQAHASGADSQGISFVRLANLSGRATLITGTDDAPLGVDLATASDGRFGPDIQALYPVWDDLLGYLPGAAAAGLLGGATPLDRTQLCSPVPRPRQVFAIGLNYRAHAAESGMELPKVPATFTKFPACITGPHDDVEIPAPTVDWEVELVVVIGRSADRVVEADAWSHVAGLTIGQDLSERTMQFAAGNQFSLGKSYRGFAPMGPWVVTPDEFGDPNDIGLGCSLDGEEVQNARTSDLVFDIASLITQLSAVLPLLSGDIIFTGTPAGVGIGRKPARFLHAGQVLETWIEGIGTMRNCLIAPAR